MNSTLGLSGEYRIRVVCGKTGRIKQEQRIKNRIPLSLREALGEHFVNSTPASPLKITHIALGDVDDVPADTDTALGNQTVQTEVTSLAGDGDVVTAAAVFAAGSATGTHAEVGVLADGLLVSRALINITVSSSDPLFIDWRLTISSNA